MIQRIQSVFLFLLVLSMVAMLFLPLWSKTDPATNQTLVLSAWMLEPEQATDAAAATLPSQGTFAIGMLAIAAAVLALYEIFQYKNRLNQMKMGLLNTLVLAALLGTSFYYAMYVGNDMVQANNPGEYEAGFYMPILALLLNALANRFIRRDENLVRSVDRLR